MSDAADVGTGDDTTTQATGDSTDSADDSASDAVTSGETSDPTDGLDPSLLDRSEPVGPCGYPGPGEGGYGVEVGQRVADFTLKNCDFEDVQFAELLCPRDDAYGDYNRAILLTIGAGWCEPCIEETATLMPQLWDPLHGEGLEIVQVLFQDGAGLPPTTSFCDAWSSELNDPPLLFPVLLDQTGVWSEPFVEAPGAAIPISMLVDANANIRWKVVGENPMDTHARALEIMASPYGF